MRFLGNSEAKTDAKGSNEKRVMAEAVKWGKRGARLNAIAPALL